MNTVVSGVWKSFAAAVPWRRLDALGLNTFAPVELFAIFELSRGKVGRLGVEHSLYSSSSSSFFGRRLKADTKRRAQRDPGPPRPHTHTTHTTQHRGERVELPGSRVESYTRPTCK